MSPRQYEFTDIIKNGLFMNTSQVGMVFDFWQVSNGKVSANRLKMVKNKGKKKYWDNLREKDRERAREKGENENRNQNFLTIIYKK